MKKFLLSVLSLPRGLIRRYALARLNRLDLCHRLGLAPAQVAMVGDRISTDVAMARKAGVFVVLVLSGEATAEDAAALSPPPDLIAGHVGELGELLERAYAMQALS